MSSLTSATRPQMAKSDGWPLPNCKSTHSTMNVQSTVVIFVTSKNSSTWQEHNWGTISRSIALQFRFSVTSAVSPLREESSASTCAWETTTWNCLKRTIWRSSSSWPRRWWSSRDKPNPLVFAKSKSASVSTKSPVSKSTRAWWSPRCYLSPWSVEIVPIRSMPTKKPFSVLTVQSPTARAAWDTTFLTTCKSLMNFSKWIDFMLKPRFMHYKLISDFLQILNRSSLRNI